MNSFNLFSSFNLFNFIIMLSFSISLQKLSNPSLKFTQNEYILFFKDIIFRHLPNI